MYSSAALSKVDLKNNIVHLILSTNNTIAPYSLNDGRRGIVPDIYKEIFKNSKYKIKLVLFSETSIKKSYTNDKYKNWISYGAQDWYDKDIYPNIDFQDNYLTLSKSVLVVKKNVLISNKKKLTLLAINGFIVTGLKALKAKITSVHRVNDTTSAFKMILNGRADAFIHDSVAMNYTLANESKFNIIQISNAKSVTVKLMFDLRSPDLKKFINKRIIILENNGVLNNVLNRYQVNRPLN